MRALHPKLHPEQIGDTVERDSKALNATVANIPVGNRGHLDTPTLALPAPHPDADTARAFVPPDDIGCPLSAPDFALAIGGAL